MVSHIQRQVNREEELDEVSQERMGQLMLSYFQMHSHEEQVLEVDGGGGRGGRDGEAEEEEYVEEQSQEADEEEGSPTASNQYLEATDFFDQSSPSMHSTAPSPFRSWNYCYDHQVAYDSEQVPTTHFRLPMPSQASNQDRRCSSSISRSSIVSFCTIPCRVASVEF